MITFNSKEEYLRWRSQWKADYKALSQQIRDLKFAKWFEDSARGGVKMSEAQTARHSGIAKQYKERLGFYPNYTLKKLKEKATAALADRKIAKQAAQEQYLKSRCSTVPS